MTLKAVSFIAPVSVTTYASQNTVNILPSIGISIAVINNTHATTVNLPASPALNQIVVVQDGGLNAATYNITVQGNGNNILLPYGSATSYVIGSNGADAWFNWNGTAWGVLA
jgi:hypothetical protein